MQIVAAERANRNADNSGYDPATYLEADLFGEEDTRSNMMRLVSQRLTKIINIPNMKDHGATGVTGCLKNIAYGSFSNVARTHQRGKSHTYSVVGTLASIEPLRSRTVLQIMDGLRGVWHGGPFARTTRYVFYPKQIMFGTDPVAIDRLLLDIIDDKRKAQGAISIWDRSPSSLKIDDGARARRRSRTSTSSSASRGTWSTPSSLGLGVYDLREDQGAGRHGMTPLLLACSPSLPVRLLDAGRREPRRRSRRRASSGSACRPTRSRPGARRVSRVAAVTDADLASREALPRPASPRAPGVASPTRSPWIVANGWRFARTPGSEVRLRPCRPERRALAAAEAFAYGADAVLKIDPADLASARRDADVPRRRCRAADLPAVADLGVVDDGSAVTGEVMNLLARRNLLFQVVQAPSPRVPHQHRDRQRRVPARRGRRSRAPSRRRSARQLTDEQRSLRDLRQRGRDRPAHRRRHARAAAPAQLRRPRHRRACASGVRGTYRAGEAYVAGAGRSRARRITSSPTARPSSRCRGSPTYAVIDLK